MQIKIERLAQKDLPRAKANCALFRNMDSADQNLSKFLSDENNILITAEINSEPVGQIIAHKLSRVDKRPAQLLLYSIDVKKNFQRKGIGTKLIEFFLQTAKQSGCGKCFVLTNNSNNAAVQLYKKTGAERLYIDDVCFMWQEK